MAQAGKAEATLEALVAIELVGGAQEQAPAATEPAKTAAEEKDKSALALDTIVVTGSAQGVSKMKSSISISTMSEQLVQFEVDGLIVSNTTLSRDGVDHLPHGAETGGLSGAPVFEKSTTALELFAMSLQGRLPLIGVGGIESGAQAQAKIDAGASLVQIYSGLIYRGPDLIAECAKALRVGKT